MQTQQLLYTDNTALTQLKKGAREKSPDAIKQVAKQFESLFVQMMLKSMRDTLPEETLFGSKNEKMYQEMFDKQLSLQISNGRGFGLSKTIERQLGGGAETNDKVPNLVDYFTSPTPVKPKKPVDNNVTVSKLHNTLVGAPSGAQSIRSHETEDQTKNNWKTVKGFINDIWPYALRAANTLGVDPDVLVAQTALETGWGKHTPKHEDGSNSFNLFGIKADSRWSGEKVEITTREYRHGVMQQEQAQFRSYPSVSQAFEDYTNFILKNPRYQQALEHGYDAKAYARELQKAGYATDPNYAKKINRVRGNEELQIQLKKLKNVPLT